jgi:hypothetical protein
MGGYWISILTGSGNLNILNIRELLLYIKNLISQDRIEPSSDS